MTTLSSLSIKIGENVKVTAKELFGINSVADQLEITKIDFGGETGSTVSFKDTAGRTKTIVFQNAEDVQMMFFQKVSTMKSKSSKKDEFASEDELSSFGNGDAKNKSGRRVRCPITNELISSEEYQNNKKEGKYAAQLTNLQ